MPAADLRSLMQRSYKAEKKLRWLEGYFFFEVKEQEGSILLSFYEILIIMYVTITIIVSYRMIRLMFAFTFVYYDYMFWLYVVIIIIIIILMIFAVIVINFHLKDV